MLDEILNSPHADALVSAAATFAVSAGFALYAHLSKRWAFLVPVGRIAGVLIEAAVARTEARVAEMKRDSGRTKLNQFQATTAKEEAIEVAEAMAKARLGASLQKTLGDARLGEMVNRAVLETKLRKQGD